MKQCTACGDLKPEDEFYFFKARNWRDSNCKKCRLAANRDYAREYHKKHARRILLKKMYGMSLEDYDKLLKQQDGVCAICLQDEPNGPLRVDHDHETGQVRGLLCHKCNAALGLLNDSPEIIAQALEYLNERSIRATNS